MEKFHSITWISKTKFVALSVCMLSSVTAPAAFAQGNELHRAYLSSGIEPVRLAGKDVYPIDTAAGGFTAEERTMIVERNLNNALVFARDKSPDAVSIAIVNGLPVVRLAGKHVLTIDTVMALSKHQTCDALAEEWVSRLKKILADKESIEHYLAQLGGDFLSSPYAVPTWREQWQAARLNYAAKAYRKDLPADVFSSANLKDEGVECMMKRDFTGAEAFFRAALMANSENERARYGLGLALLKEGHLEPAIVNLCIARYLEPDDPQVHIALGQAFESQGDDNNAIESYRVASKIAPENPEPALYIADMREERDQIGRSVDELGQSLSGSPASEYLRLRRKDQLSWRLTRPY